MPDATARFRRTVKPLITLSVGVLGFAMLAWAFWETYSELERTTEQEALNHLRLEYEALSDYQQQLARQVFEDRLQRPPITRLMAQATNAAGAATRDRLRAELHARLDDLYTRLQEKGFRQLHFHLPEAVSFLRFHRPGRYGDSLWDVRAGLRKVNETRAPVRGFEEGRVFNGFRYIFPLFHDGAFVGSVETSYSFRSFLLHHADLDHGVYRLLVDQGAVVNKVWDAERNANYRQSLLHPGFMVDRQADLTTLPDLVPGQDSWDAERFQALGRALGPRVRQRMDRWEAFAAVLRGPEPVVAAFMPIETTTGEPGAYMLRYARAEGINRAWASLWIKLILTGTLILMAVATVVVLERREGRRIEERERLLSSLREREHGLRQAQRIARLGNWELDLATESLSWSDEIFGIFGLDPERFEATYETFLNAVHPADRQRVRDAVRQALEAGSTYDIEHRVIRPDGAIRHVHERARVERDAQGHPICMRGTVQDITERRLAEEERRQAAAIIESTREGVMVTDGKGVILSVNPAFTRLTGYSEDIAVGQSARILRSRHQDEQLFASMWQALEADGQWEGEIWNRRADGELRPMRLSITSITTDWGERRYVGLLTDISAAKAREEAMWHRAHHDPLTELPNRLLLRERLERALTEAHRHGDWVAVLYVDLDDFKPINDRFGHDAGDRVLQNIARRMQGALRQSDTVARLGGDEFAVLVMRPRQGEDALRVAEKLLAAIREPTQWQGHRLGVSASIGIARYPGDGSTASALIDAADGAMYRVKHDGKNAIGMSEPDAEQENEYTR